MRSDAERDYLTSLMAAHEDAYGLDDLLARPSWHADAACREHPELPWVPPPYIDPALYDAMKACCADCLFRQDCLDYALASDDRVVGVWGGTSEQQRIQLRRAQPAVRKRRTIIRTCVDCGKTITNRKRCNACAHRHYRARQRAV